MEVYAPRYVLSPRQPLFFLILAACWASLIRCSLCLDAQYEYCLNARNCGIMNITYPFGAGKRGCGHPAFQINCMQNATPVIEIHGRSYTILRRYSALVFLIVRGENCNFFNGPFNNLQIQLSEHGNASCYISGKENRTLDVYKCIRFQEPDPFQDAFDSTGGQLWKCNATVYYDFYNSGYSIRGCSMEEVEVEVGRAECVSNDRQRDKVCRSCEASGGICGYNISDSTSPFLCYCKDGPRPGHGPSNKSAIIIIIGGPAFTAVALVLFFTFYVKKKRHPPPGSSASKVEKFLKEYAYEMPTRYSFSHLKKITNNFAEKLGEGGYGVVYKGKLSSNEAPVAVKILDRRRHSEVQFMNEVGTIGRVHHVNLVKLLGYCFESPTSALVYEYMLNGSLDKFLFAREERGQVLKWGQLHSIALGSARGIAYLHQDCEKRIIHFDIKPHNILLNADFAPKVSDFGLAVLCGKEDDHISMTAGRGTLGYVAPEVCDSDMGPVTDKSDVYSFGMLLLEIAGGRKNIDFRVSRSSQQYFPEWAFKMLQNEKLQMRSQGEIEGELEAEVEEKGRKLMTKVGLWCIQHQSRDRPCMSRVVQMLEGNGDDVDNPPAPFNSSSAPP